MQKPEMQKSARGAGGGTAAAALLHSLLRWRGRTTRSSHVVLIFTRIIKSVVTGQAPGTLEHGDHRREIRRYRNLVAMATPCLVVVHGGRLWGQARRTDSITPSCPYKNKTIYVVKVVISPHLILLATTFVVMKASYRTSTTHSYGTTTGSSIIYHLNRRLYAISPSNVKRQRCFFLWFNSVFIIL